MARWENADRFPDRLALPRPSAPRNRNDLVIVNQGYCRVCLAHLGAPPPVCKAHPTSCVDLDRACPTVARPSALVQEKITCWPSFGILVSWPKRSSTRRESP